MGHQTEKPDTDPHTRKHSYVRGSSAGGARGGGRQEKTEELGEMRKAEEVY